MSAPWRIGEVAQRLGLSTDTVREYVRRGILPATRSPSGSTLVRRGRRRDDPAWGGANQLGSRGHGGTKATEGRRSG